MSQPNRLHRSNKTLSAKVALMRCISIQPLMLPWEMELQRDREREREGERVTEKEGRESHRDRERDKGERDR